MELDRQRVKVLDLKEWLWIYTRINASGIWLLFFRHWTEWREVVAGKISGDVAQHMWGAKVSQLPVPLPTPYIYYFILSPSFRRQVENKKILILCAFHCRK